MWINPASQVVFRFHHEIRAQFPNTSIPSHLTDAVIESLGLARIVSTEKPSGHIVEELPPAQVDNVWTQQWSVRQPTEEETVAKAAAMRVERNRYLSESDWTQVADAPVDKEVWTSYRQALRDITEQAGFPWEVSWPEQP